MTLFNRKIIVKIISSDGSSIITLNPEDNESVFPFKIAFNCKKTSGLFPDECDLKIYNLNESNRKRLSTKDDRLDILVGYGSAETLVFTGAIFNYNAVRSGTEWISNMKLRDSSGKQRASLSIPANTPYLSYISQLIDATELNPGNVLNVATRVYGQMEESKKPRIRTTLAVKGNAYKALARALQSLDLNLVVQDGSLLARERIITFGNLTVVKTLSSDSGLIGSPEVSEAGIITFQSVLDPSIKPLSLIKLESRQFNEVYKILSVQHQGDNYSNSWTSAIEAQVINEQQVGS